MDDEEFPDKEIDDYIDPEASELAWQTIVQAKAKQMAQEYGVDKQRVEAIIYRLTEVGWTGFKFPLRNALEVAFDYFKPAKALELFETEPVDMLAVRFYFVRYVRLKETLMYSLHELSDLTEEFLSHLESNRQHLLETGWPQTTFEKCRWLDWHVNMLYFVKLPLIEGFQHWALDHGIEHTRKPGRYETKIERDEKGNYRWKYRWAKEQAMQDYPWPPELPPDSEFRPRIRTGYFVTSRDARTLDQQPVTLCKYKEAGLIEGLEPQDSARIEEMRCRIYDIKVNILRRLLRAVRSRNATDLWGDCLGILTDKATGLMADEAEFLMGVERFLTEFQPFPRSTYSHSRQREVHHVAGLSDLLEVIGHFEKEITIGTMDKTSEVLKDLPSTASFRSYFEVIGKPWQMVVDRAADLSLELASEEKVFWETYQGRVNEALEKEFYEEVVFRKKRRRKFKHKFDSTADTLLDYMESHMEATGEPPPVELHMGETTSPPKDHVFRREDDHWKIKYQGIERTLQNTLGLEYIHFLIRHPWKEFTAPQLEAIIKERRLDPSTDAYRKMTDEQLTEENLRIPGKEDIGDDDDKIDKRGREDYRRTVSQLEEKREEALKGGQTNLAEHCQRQIKSIETRLQADTGLGGHPRKFSDEDEKARQRVCRAIDRALVKIESKNLPLWRHLNTALKPLGYHLSYRPDRVLDWVTQ